MNDTYRIIPANPGQIWGTKVIGPDGQELRGVKTVEYVHDAGELPLIRVTVYAEQAGELTATRERVEIVEKEHG